MNKSEFVRDLRLPDEGLGYGALFSGLLNCLSADEVCDTLDLQFHQSSKRREKILRRIAADMENDFREKHFELANNLVSSLSKLPYPKQTSCAYCLSYLFNLLPIQIQEVILRIFLFSYYRSFRKRAYKILQEIWDETCIEQIANSWSSYRDIDAAKLIIDKFPIEFLADNFDELSEDVRRSRHFSILFVRLYEQNPEILELLNADKDDEMTHLYVLTKVNRPVTYEQALSIFEKYKDDDKIGLIIWCFGQMKLWDVLVKIADMPHDIAR